jgi:ribosomal protein L18E
MLDKSVIMQDTNKYNSTCQTLATSIRILQSSARISRTEGGFWRRLAERLAESGIGRRRQMNMTALARKVTTTEEYS